jgi:hypothetical protein
MPRYVTLILMVLFCVGVILLPSRTRTVLSRRSLVPDRTVRQKSLTAQDAGLQVEVTPWGATQKAIDEVTARLPEQGALKDYLQNSRYRLIAFELIETEKGERTPPAAFRATYYNYSSNRTVRAEGSFDDVSQLQVKVSNDQPTPSNEEFAEAIAILSKDAKIGSDLSQNRLVANPAMPPVLYSEDTGEGEAVERTINILLLPTAKSSVATEVVGVNMVRESIVHYPGGAPGTSKAAATACGIPSAGQSTTSSGTAGQYEFVVSKAGVEIWRFIAIRPSASSGPGDRSGIELQNVKYRGKMVLKRMHAPILNVNYDGNACGPFRDWQWQEGMFQATGTDVPGTNGGVRDCGTTPATTALDTDNDFGNFRGIAFYKEGTDDLVLVSEMNAGWYRYICEYRFNANGTIRPRYGYGATTNSCVCLAHTHHVYWRFDFDIGGNVVPAANVVRPSRREFNWSSPYALETKVQRTGTRQNWLVENPATLDSYMIRPNGSDGTASSASFGKGDVWVLVFKSNEISDRDTGGVNIGSAANIDGFMTSPESLVNQDIVVWYGGHFYHNDGGNGLSLPGPRILHGEHVQGPDLIPVRW